jgi:FkbM family methyltransferase
LLVYDVGMAAGQDSAYYLAKGCRVVAVDANGAQCAAAERRFGAEIAEGRLTVVHAGVGAQPGRGRFHVHESLAEISTFVPEAFAGEAWAAGNWREIDTEVVRLSDLIGVHGEPDFLKIDIEFEDAAVLRELHAAGVRPPLIAVEAQQIDTLCILVAMQYRRFRLLIGEDIAARFGDVAILRADGSRAPWRFDAHSSGPFGEDFGDPWLDAETVMRQLLAIGPGWIDVHAGL